MKSRGVTSNVEFLKPFYQTRDGLWYVLISDMPNSSQTAVFQTRLEAYDFCGLSIPSAGPEVPFYEVVDVYLNACAKGKDGNLPLQFRTIRQYEYYLKKWVGSTVGNVPIGDLNTQTVRGLRDDMLRTAGSRRTIQKVIYILSSMLGWARRYGYVPSNEAIGIKVDLWHGLRGQPKVRPVYSDAEVLGLYCALQRLERKQLTVSKALTWEKYGLLCRTLLFMGLRSSEALGLKYSDFSNDFESVMVRRRIEPSRTGMTSFLDRESLPKSRYGKRQLPVSPNLRTRLRRWSRMDLRSDYVFPSKTGGPLEYQTLRRYMWQPLVKESGLLDYGMHSLRHYYASVLIRNKCYFELSRLLGHCSTHFTMDRYGHLIDDDLGRLTEIASQVESRIYQTGSSCGD